MKRLEQCAEQSLALRARMALSLEQIFLKETKPVEEHGLPLMVGWGLEGKQAASEILAECLGAQ
jgi:hypothetical protein